MKDSKSTRWPLVIYDVAILFLVDLFLLLLTGEELPFADFAMQFGIGFSCIFLCRYFGSIYQQIWRYGGIQCYIRLMVTDGVAFLVTFCAERMLAPEHITLARILAISAANLLGSLAIRMLYRYAYKCGTETTFLGRLLLLSLRIFAGSNVVGERNTLSVRVPIAIIGAGRVGVGLAEELMNNPAAAYIPRCFVDVNREKAGRDIHGLPVFLESEATLQRMEEHGIQEVVFAIPNLADDVKRNLYQYYSKAGYKAKIYDFPMMHSAGGRRHLREFDIEELLFRKPVDVVNEKTISYYKNKVILITGGGGSIGSELCRQLARMQPKQLIVLDIYENCAYDIQQGLKFAYPDLDIQVEIVSITNKIGLSRVFRKYHPEIVINAAAHKHVPLMEKNCIEAVENNVFGTLNVVQCCEEFGAERFMMVSTDKAVNPTNVMGATKRMCEMIIQAYSSVGKVKYSATRFGNVLGSAGSVIPLFRRQIAAGGPVTLTDKRIIRYFMTIPEASQLVLTSGAMANNGELFVLDMGQPVRILDLAENMIRLSGVSGIEIVETGLRPGEKLYEELLVKTENLDKTDNDLIFIEHEVPITMEEINEKLAALHQAIQSDEDEAVRAAMHRVVPTYKTPEEVNRCASEAKEMQSTKVLSLA